MLEEVCKELNNWFVKEKYIGEFTVENGALLGASALLADGQYFRITGSVHNDGVYRYPVQTLTDETFTGGVWAMAVPRAVLALTEEIAAWNLRYGSDTAAMSPFTGEAFGSYRYTKKTDGKEAGWEHAFGRRLNRWRKAR
ncbi:MAG: hypothetical protein IJK40_00930 [Clostridia bacterium]|nr:hypothetical protein [Clostridia bacterium]